MSEAIPGNAISELTEESLRAMLQRVYEQTEGNPLYDRKAMAELVGKPSGEWEDMPDLEGGMIPKQISGSSSPP